MFNTFGLLRFNSLSSVQYFCGFIWRRKKNSDFGLWNWFWQCFSGDDDGGGGDSCLEVYALKLYVTKILCVQNKNGGNDFSKNPFFLGIFFPCFSSSFYYCWLYLKCGSSIDRCNNNNQKKISTFFFIWFLFSLHENVNWKSFNNLLIWFWCQKRVKKISCFMMNELRNLKYSSFGALNEFSSCWLDVFVFSCSE